MYARYATTERFSVAEVKALIEVAAERGLDDDATFKIEYDASYLQDVMTISDDGYLVGKRHSQTPVEHVIESGGERRVELGFVRSSDVRKPTSVLLRVIDQDTGIVMTSLSLSEHDFVLLLAGHGVSAKDET